MKLIVIHDNASAMVEEQFKVPNSHKRFSYRLDTNTFRKGLCVGYTRLG